MSASHDPPETYRFNKLRSTGGSARLTLVKAAVDRAEIDARPPRPVFAHLPAAPGAWLAADVDVYESQRRRVEARAAVTGQLATDFSAVGEFPIHLKGKLGSAVTRVPKGVLDHANLEVGEEITAIAVGSGAVLLLTKQVVYDDLHDIEETIAAARTSLK